VSCFPDTGYQRFVLGANSVTLNADAFIFRSGVGENWLDAFGCERIIDPEYLARTFFGYTGTSHWEAPIHNAPYSYQWRLQLLSDATYYGLRALSRRAIATRSPIRLFDNLILLDESAPRTRARVGSTALAAAPDTVLFYPQFQIALSVAEGIPTAAGWNLEMSAVEYSPNKPIPITEDVAA
jgi:hypothetical protein